MTKAELIKIITKKTGVDQPTTLAVVDGMLDTLMETLINKENVYIRGWGTWQVVRRKRKTARNIKKNTTIIIEAHDVPAFKPCKEFLQAVANSPV